MMIEEETIVQCASRVFKRGDLFRPSGWKDRQPNVVLQAKRKRRILDCLGQGENGCPVCESCLPEG